MPNVKKGLSAEDVITRHQPSVMEGNNVASVDHGKDKYPRAYYKADLRTACDKADMGTPGDTKMYAENPVPNIKTAGSTN